MRKKGLFLLSGITVVAIAAAAWAVRERSSSASTSTRGGQVFSGLADRLNEATELFVTDGKGSLTLRREGDAWGLVESGNYPAKFEKLKETIVGLSRLEIEEPKTRKKEQYAALGVQDPAPEGTTSKRVVLKNAKGETLAAAVVSEPKYRGSSQTLYVRREGDDQVYLCEGRLTLNVAPQDWLERELLRLEGDRVQEVRIVHKDGEEVNVGRSTENHTQFEIKNLPPEQEPSYAGVANNLGTALSSLELVDAKPESEVDFSAEPLAKAYFRCHDGLSIEIESARVAEKTWIKLHALYEEPAAAEPSSAQAAEEPAGETPAASPDGEVPGDQAPEEEAAAAPPGEAEASAPDGEAADPEEPNPETIQQEVADLNEKFTGWAFEIQSYKGDVLARRMEDLLKKPEEAQAPEGAGIEGELPAELKELLENQQAEDEVPPPTPDEPPADETPSGDPSDPRDPDGE